MSPLSFPAEAHPRLKEITGGEFRVWVRVWFTVGFRVGFRV